VDFENTLFSFLVKLGEENRHYCDVWPIKGNLKKLKNATFYEEIFRISGFSPNSSDLER